MSVFLKYPNISGPSTSESYKGWIPLTTFTWGFSNTTTRSRAGGGGGGEAEKLLPTEVTITFPAFYNSPLFFLACAQAKTANKVLVAFTTTSGQSGASKELEQITLEDAVVSSYYTAASSSSDSNPTDTITLVFRTMTIERLDVSGQPITETVNFG